MSDLHVSTTLILFFTVTTILVNVESTTKRHDPNPGRPRAAQPMCHKICYDVSSYCERSCYGASANQWYAAILPGKVAMSNPVDQNKFHCLSNCIHDDMPIMFNEDNCTYTPVMASGQNNEPPQIPKKREIDVAALTMSERCLMEEWSNSTVCEFDKEYPTISKKVFDANRHKLTLCTGSPVLAGSNGFSLKTLVSKKERQGTAIPSRKRRNVVNKLKGQAERDIRQSRDNRTELCPTVLHYESPMSALHIATNKVVDIYFYAGYSQWFELGACESKDPKKVNSEIPSATCEEVTTAVKAWLMIKPESFTESEMKKVKNCGTVKQVPYLVCNDWVVLPTHCKLFFTK